MKRMGDALEIIERSTLEKNFWIINNRLIHLYIAAESKWKMISEHFPICSETWNELTGALWKKFSMQIVMSSNLKWTNTRLNVANLFF